MPITLNCPKCHKPFRVRDESIGGRVRCPSCGAVLQVPAALSPASNFGEGPKLGSSEDGTRPVAEEVHGQSHPGVSVHEIAVGGRSREGAVDLGAPPGVPMLGPPSIKARQPVAPSPPVTSERPSAPVSLPKMPLPATGSRTSAPPRPLSDEELPWARVGKGLGMIRGALFLLVFWVLAVVAQGVWTVYDYDRAWSDAPGLLKRPDWPLKKEVFVAYTVALSVPAVLLLLAGRLRCGGAPADSHARGLALSAAFFTFVAVAGTAVFLALTFFNVSDKLHLPDDMAGKVRLTGIYAAVPSALLADILTLLFVGQIGWPIKRPQLQKSVAGFFAYALLLPAAVLIGEQFYPVSGELRDSWRKVGSVFGGPEDDLAKRVVIWTVILFTAVLLLILRYAAVTGRARRAIRKLLAG